LIHVGNIDAYRHETGVFSKKVEKGVIECDEMLSRLIAAAKEAGTFENTDFIVVSDHGHLDASRIVNVNVRLRQEGLIRTDEGGARLGYHGHHPDKGPEPVFMAIGPSFIPGARIGRARLVDMAPICAYAMGVELPDCDGTAMTALQKKKHN